MQLSYFVAKKFREHPPTQTQMHLSYLAAKVFQEHAPTKHKMNLSYLATKVFREHPPTQTQNEPKLLSCKSFLGVEDQANTRTIQNLQNFFKKKWQNLLKYTIFIQNTSLQKDCSKVQKLTILSFSLEVAASPVEAAFPSAPEEIAPSSPKEAATLPLC